MDSFLLFDLLKCRAQLTPLWPTNISYTDLLIKLQIDPFFYFIISKLSSGEHFLTKYKNAYVANPFLPKRWSPSFHVNNQINQSEQEERVLSVWVKV